MEPVLQFDAASLSIFYTGLPLAEDGVDVLGPVARAALLGDHAIKALLHP